jgi:excisionase family DNA binding protein
MLYLSVRWDRQSPLLIGKTNRSKKVQEQLRDVLTIEQAAEYLQISQSTLYKEAQKGKIPCKKIGKRWRFHRAALAKWMGEMPVETDAVPRTEAQ